VRGSLRRRWILNAFRKDPPSRTETWAVDGFAVVLDPAFPSPAPRFGWSYQSMVGGCVQARPGEQVVDLDAGAGLIALHAARRGASVTCIDREPASLRCIRRSFLMAGLGEPGLAPGERLDAGGAGPFDVITWTAPFLDGPPGASRVEGPRSVAEAVFADVRERLARGGRFLFAWPDRDAGEWLGPALTKAGFRWSAVHRARFPVVGTVRVYRCWSPPRDEPAGEISGGDALPGAAWVLRDR